MKLEIMMLGIVNFTVVLGNLLVFYVILTKKSLQTSTNTLVLSLTISDLLLGVLILPFAIIQENSHEWHFGLIGCRLWLSLDIFLSTASIYNLLAISFDRYMAVRQPIKYTIISSTKVVRLMTFLVWMCSLILATILFVLESVLSSNTSNECQPTNLPSPYIIFSALASFIVPAFVMIILNIRIFRTVLQTSRTMTVKSKNGSLRVHRRETSREPRRVDRFEVKPATPTTPPSVVVAVRHSRQHPLIEDEMMSADDPAMKKTSGIDSPTIRSILTSTVIFGFIETRRPKLINQIASRKVQRSTLRTELRVARTTGIVVAAFIVCWIPFTTIYVLQSYQFCTVTAKCVPEWLFVIAFWLGYANSAINPILYAAFSRDIRRSLRKTILRKKSRAF